MKTYSVLIATLFVVGCGRGIAQLSHSGVCDGYPDWETSDYKLPWPAGVTHQIAQGNCAGASHIGSQRYAYDIQMDIGTTVIAARDGVVIEAEGSHPDGGGCSQLNQVRIKHSDGTIANYLHLTQNGALVTVGQNVTQGMTIAHSGNSGCTSGPHLHFMVQTPDEKDSMPVTFRNTTTNIRGLQETKEYTAQ